MIKINGLIIIGIIALIISIIFRKNIASDIIKGQNDFGGFNFGKKEVKLSEVLVVLIPLLWIIIMLFIKIGLIK